MEKCRLIQKERYKTEGFSCNAKINAKSIKKYCVLDNQAKELLKMAMTELKFSARAYDKILKVSRTIADMAESEIIKDRGLKSKCFFKAFSVRKYLVLRLLP